MKNWDIVISYKEGTRFLLETNTEEMGMPVIGHTIIFKGYHVKIQEIQFDFDDKTIFVIGDLIESNRSMYGLSY